MSNFKTCTSCKLVKRNSTEDFHRNRNTLYSVCKRCKSEVASERYRTSLHVKLLVRQSNIRRKYGLSPQDYEELLDRQNNSCAICLNLFSGGPRARTAPAVDHCHETGAIRGLLCQACNRGLGMFYDNREALLNAINYLNGFHHADKEIPEDWIREGLATRGESLGQYTKKKQVRKNKKS